MQSETKLINNMTEGPLLRQLFKFALPVMLANALQAVYSMVDMIVVGQYVGAAGLSAVGVGGQLLNMFLCIGMGMGFGAQILISQQVGYGDENLSPTIGTLFTTEAILALVFGAVGIICSDWLLSVMNTPPEAWQDAKNYLIICCCGMLFIYGYNAVCSILRGMGESKLPMIFIAIASVVNLVLDLLFVAVFRWSAAGAALATVIAQGVAFISSLVYLFKNRARFGFDFQLSSFRIRRRYLLPISKLGGMYIAQSLMITVSMMYVNAQVNVYGVVASAVDSIGGKLNTIMNIVVGGISVSSSTIIAQSFGARKFDRMKQCYRACLAICMITFVVLSAVYLIFPKQVFSIFSSDSEVIALAPQYLQIAVVWLLSICTMTPAYGIMDGVGAAGFGLITSILDGVIARLGLCILLGSAMGLSGYWWGNALAGFVTTIMCGAYYYSGRWKKRRLLLDNGEASDGTIAEPEPEN